MMAWWRSFFENLAERPWQLRQIVNSYPPLARMGSWYVPVVSSQMWVKPPILASTVPKSP